MNKTNEYYDAGGISTIEFIKAKLTPEQYEGFLLGNIIKYTARANHKETFSTDVYKASTYSTWLQAYKEQQYAEEAQLDYYEEQAEIDMERNAEAYR